VLKVVYAKVCSINQQSALRTGGQPGGGQGFRQNVSKSLTASGNISADTCNHPRVSTHSILSDQLKFKNGVDQIPFESVLKSKYLLLIWNK